MAAIIEVEYVRCDHSTCSLFVDLIQRIAPVDAVLRDFLGQAITSTSIVSYVRRSELS